MKKNDRLFDLIRALTKNEKGYFKKFSLAYSQKEDSNQYIKLFDAIDGQKEYDEDPLIKKFSKGNKKFNFSAAKNFLYDRILNSLESYHAGRAAGEIRSYLNQVEILRQKLLNLQAEKLLDKAEQLAEKHCIDELMPDIILKRIMLWKIRKFSGISPDQVQSAIDKLNLHLKHVAELSGVYHFQFQYDNVFTSQGAISDRENLKEFDKLLSTIEASGISDSASFQVQVGYLLLLHSMYMFADKVEKAYAANLKLLGMFEADPVQMTQRRGQYHHTLARIVESQTGMRHFEEAKANLQKLRDSALTNASASDNYFWSYYTVMLQILLSKDMRDFKTLRQLVEENQSLIYPRFVDIRSSDIQLKIHAAEIYFYWAEYETVLGLLNDILNNPRNDVRTDLYCYAKVLLLITYWEMGNLSVMPHELKSSRNFFETRLALLDSDKIILRFIEKHLRKNVNSRSLSEPFKQLKKDLDLCFEDKFNTRPAQYIDIPLWIESKLQRKPISELGAIPR